jgi:hypothetical protein
MSVTIQPIFIKDTIEYPFEGCKAGLPKGHSMEFRFIVNTLRDRFGDDLDFTEKDGLFIMPSDPQILEEIKSIYKYSNEFPLKREQSHLRFDIISIDIVGLTEYEY